MTFRVQEELADVLLNLDHFLVFRNDIIIEAELLQYPFLVFYMQVLNFYLLRHWKTLASFDEKKWNISTLYSQLALSHLANLQNEFSEKKDVNWERQFRTFNHLVSFLLMAGHVPASQV